MKNISFISPFCDLLKSLTSTSILDRARKKGIVKYNYLDLFSYSDDPHNRIDDYPYGGGEGMILQAQPIFSAYDSIIDKAKKTRVIYPTPDGEKLSMKLSLDLSKEDNIIFICGHYKGIDQRVRDELVTDEISIGDYILTGGELPACVITDSIVRLIPGVINNIESAKTDSFYEDLLDNAHYTRPDVFRDLKVPDILLSGNHKEIEKWKLNSRIDKTKTRRKDLYKKYLKNNNQKVEKKWIKLWMLYLNI